MTRKHYQILANVINDSVKESFLDWNENERSVLFEFIGEWFLPLLLSELKADNRNFSKEKFIEALEYKFQ